MHKRVYEHLKSVANVFLNEAPFLCEPPYVTYKKVSRSYTHDIDGNDSLEKATFQVDIWGLKFSECAEIYKKIQTALKNRVFEVRYSEDFEHETKLNRISVDFEIWEDQI